MKLRYLSGILLLATGLFFASCDDEDDYAVGTGEIISEITTGDANVTAVSAEIQGTVKDLGTLSPASYKLGVCYGTAADPTVSGARQTGTVDENGNVATLLTGLTTGTTYYYATYVTLQNKVTKFGDIKSFVATAAKVSTKDAADITSCKATFAADITGTEGLDSPEAGVKLAFTAEGITSGRSVALSTVGGLLPGTTYYYAAFVKVGDGCVYGATKSFTTGLQQMEYVDMGVSVLWAKYNIGAEAESEAGALFGYDDATGILYDLSLDADSPMKSQMPTGGQIAELINNTTQEIATVDGVEGMRFMAKNGNSIFLPMAGYSAGESVVSDATGYYWSGNVSNVNNEYANTLTFNGSFVKTGFSKRHLGLSVRSVRPYAEVNPDAGKLVFGDLEGKGHLRIEIYNEYGATKNNPPIDLSMVKFSRNMVVTFTLTGITDNLKDDAAGSYVAGLAYADASWGSAYWSELTKGIYETVVTGDGTYSVWMEPIEPAEGTVVFCVDIAGLAADIEDMSKVGVAIHSIKLDADVEQAVDASIVSFNNKDGNGEDGRIEIYNEYGTSGAAAQGIYNNSLKFHDLMLVDFTISGIDGNLVDGASKSYKTELSYADASWGPAYWGGADYGSTTVTGDGTYQVYTYLNGDCEGAVVWTIELPGLWKELVDTSKVKVQINKVITPGKN